SIAATPFIGAEFIPAGDQGQLDIKVETRASSSLAATEEVTDQINKELEAYEDIINVSFVSIGEGGVDGSTSADNEASYTIELVSADERDVTTKELVTELDEKLAHIVGAEVTVSEADGGLGMGDPVQIELSGQEHEVLRDLADEIKADISNIEAVTQMKLTVDDEIAKTYSLTANHISAQIENQFIGETATVFRDEGKEFDVTLTYTEEEKKSIADLQDMKVDTPVGSSISLEEVAEFKEVLGPVTLTRENQQSQTTVTSELADRDLGSVTTDIEAYLDDFNFPEGYSYNI